MCNTFVVFTHCESCARPIYPGSMEAGKYGLTRGMCFGACRLEVVGGGGMPWIPWCVLDAAGLFVFSMSLHFQIRGARAATVDSVKGQRQPANLPTDNSCPTDPHQVYHLLCSHLRITWRRLIRNVAHSVSSPSNLRPDESDFKHFSNFESTLRAAPAVIAGEKKHSGRRPQEGC